MRDFTPDPEVWELSEGNGYGDWPEFAAKRKLFRQFGREKGGRFVSWCKKQNNTISAVCFHKPFCCHQDAKMETPFLYSQNDYRLAIVLLLVFMLT